MYRIGIDAMGGDYAPDVVVEGAIMALGEIEPESRIVLFGDKDRICKLLRMHNCPEDTFDIVPTTQVITMDDHPVKAFSSKTDSSITVGFNYLKRNAIDGFASAGSTGAMMTGAMYSSEVVRNVIRPAISVKIPTADGGNVLLLDVGLNVDCKPDVLYQYGILGSVYAQSVLGKEHPRVALLNIGEEKEKGNLVTKATYELMASTEKFNFSGNIEARDIFTGQIADVIVCDGFVGNTILKQTEGFYRIAKMRGINDDYIDQLNYEQEGGTVVLGINAIVLIGHGCSTAHAIKNMILQTEKSIKAGLVNNLQDIFRDF